MERDEMNDMINFFFKRNVICHIETRDKIFYNGMIIEVHPTFIVIRDRVVGEVPIPYSEIKVVERFRGKEE